MFNKTIDFRCIFHFIAILNASAVEGCKLFVGRNQGNGRNTLSITKIRAVAACFFLSIHSLGEHALLADISFIKL